MGLLEGIPVGRPQMQSCHRNKEGSLITPSTPRREGHSETPPLLPHWPPHRPACHAMDFCGEGTLRLLTYTAQSVGQAALPTLYSVWKWSSAPMFSSAEKWLLSLIKKNKFRVFLTTARTLIYLGMENFKNINGPMRSWLVHGCFFCFFTRWHPMCLYHSTWIFWTCVNEWNTQSCYNLGRLFNAFNSQDSLTGQVHRHSCSIFEEAGMHGNEVFCTFSWRE